MDPYFQSIVKATCGITCEFSGSLLSSVPVEMVFNDMRDAARRFSKCEVTTPSNMHSIVARSCKQRVSGMETVLPQAHDWSFSLNGKTLKRSVFDSGRLTDCQLGVSTSGLTRKKADVNLTKPHVFAYRLHLLEILHELWRHCDEPGNFSAEVMYRKLWMSCLFETGLLMMIDLPRFANKTFLVLVPGPFSVACVEVDAILEVENGCTLLDDPTFIRIPITDLQRVKVGKCTPIVLKDVKRMGWKLFGEWMSIQSYVAFESILRISAKILSSLCSELKIRGHSKLDHKRKVELYLKHMECDQEYIDAIMAQIPEKEVKPRKNPEQEDGDGNNEEETVFV